MSKTDELNKIKQAILDANVCPGLAKTATQLVFGDGPADAEIVFVGEAPGKKEDEQGLPFVGAAGKFLDEMLGTIGLERSDVYITNIVKYRPPANRDPLPDEKAEFLPFLKRQLEIIKPKLVVTLGRHSMEALLPRGLSISACHGQPKHLKIRLSSLKLEDSSSVEPQKPNSELQTLNSDSWVILPLFHPAAALYNGAMRQTLIDDFSKIPVILNKIQQDSQISTLKKGKYESR